ncbi:hypothetical protein [Paenibacillus sp. FSL R7-0652]|uniref:hypothetical protein n=1 Tax=Paenibacillus sp. FSL R7-0652 TaxID=2921687 RepID=UPI00315AEE00
MLTALFRKFDDFSMDLLSELLQASPTEASERITELSITEEGITMDYYRTIRSVELFYDFISEVEVPEIVNKAHKASCIISKKRNIALIYGNRVACNNFERYLKNKAQINLFSNFIELGGLLNKLSEQGCRLKKLDYIDVEFLGTVLNSLSLDFKTNHDAERILKRIPTNPSKASLELFFDKKECTFNIDLVNSSIKVEYDTLEITNIELVKEIIIDYFEEE